MTRDDVIRLAREAGFDVYETLEEINGVFDTAIRFAELVIKEHTQQVITEPAEIRRVFEIDAADWPEPESGFAMLGKI